MSEIHWVEFGLALHMLLAAAAIWFAAQVEGYTREQRILQYLIAALVPALGAIAVYVMAREADAPMPPPRSTRFDRAGD